MGKVQVAAAVTLDGFLPDKKEKELWEWMRTNRRGFPYWREQATFKLFADYPMIEILSHQHLFQGSYYAEVSDAGMVEVLRMLGYFNLVDEFALYVFPISYGKGIPLYDCFQRCDWKLCGVKTFRNGICRMVYRRLGHHL